MTKTVCIAQARMSSTRLPGKVLKDINGRPTLSWVVEAAEAAPGVDEVIVATTTKSVDDPIVHWCSKNDVRFFRGSEDDVLSRYMGAIGETDAEIIVRLTADCPLLDPNVIGEVIQLRKMKGAMYATNTDPPTYPDGLDVEVFTREALEIANREAIRASDRDTVTRFIVRNRHRFPAANLVCPLPDLVRERWVLDSPEDYEFLKILTPLLRSTSYLHILSVLDDNPNLKFINSHLSRNERFYAGLAVEKDVRRSYSISKACLAEAEALIPLGAQTFSKSKLQFPAGVSPLFLSHGDGGYCFDVDGNDYVDLVGGLLPNILGYRDPDVDGAIRDQLNNGISFSLATMLETKLAERLHQHIPSADMVRFGKNGSDVTTAAVRLARHITRRDKVLVGGYHGWHDWSIGAEWNSDLRNDRTLGIPTNVCALSERQRPSDQMPEDWDAGSYAAIIVEPEFYTREQLAELRRWCSKHSIVLIFDEIISGFRCGMGGLQGVTGVTPDLSTFGKAMANGMPISALVGRERFMLRMPELAYSGTFFGETLSIAASIATLDKLHRECVPGYLMIRGLELRNEIRALLGKYSVDKISLYGELSLNRIKFSDKTTQSIFIQEMAKNGVLIIGSHNTCWAHKNSEFDRVLSAWEQTLRAIVDDVELEGEVIQGRGVR